MRSMPRALLLAALLVAPLVPTAWAGVPQPAPWAPYDAISSVNAIGLADAGPTVAAALAKRATNTEPAVPGAGATRVATTDLAVLTMRDGHVYNGTDTANPLGKSHVAVSRNGNAIASLGNETTTVSPVEGVLKLRYVRLPSGSNWTAGTPEAETVNLGGRAVGLALSADGDRVAVLRQDTDERYVLSTYRWSSGSLSLALEYEGLGDVDAFAADADLTRLFVVGQFARQDQLLGGLLMFDFEDNRPLASHYAEGNNTRFVSVATSADGRRVAAGTSEGAILLFNQRTGSLEAPAAFNLAPGEVRPLAMSGDGSRVSAVADRVLGHLDVAAGFRLLWNTTLANNATSLDLNHTGAILVVGVGGSGGGVFAYGDKSTQPVWTRPGPTSAVAVNAAGTQLAYAQRSFITAATLPRQISFEFPGGADTGVQRDVERTGVAVFDLQVRNPGAAPESVVFEAPDDIDARITTEPSRILVYPDEILPVRVSVAVGPDFGTGRVFNLTARAPGAGLTDDVTLSVQVVAQANVTLFLNETEVRAVPGQTKTLLVGIVNNGTSEAELAFTAEQAVTQGEPWNVTVEQGAFTLLPNTRTSVRVHVTPPAEVANGTTNVITFRVEGPDGIQQGQVVFRINPKLSMEMDAVGRVRFIEPGQSASYNVTITNTGSLDRDFETWFEITSGADQPWAVDMETGTFHFPAGHSRTFPVRIVAPAAAEPLQDRVSVLIEAKSVPVEENETVVRENLTLYANVEPPKPTTTTPTGVFTPLPGALLAVLAVVVAVRLLPRRPFP